VTVVRVLLVDSNDDFLEGLTAWLAGEPNVEIVGSANTGAAALELIERLRPDLVLVDVSMSPMNGFEATRKIKAAPRAPIVVMTTFHASQTARNEAWAAGADALLAKAEVTARLKGLIRDIGAERPLGTGAPSGTGPRTGSSEKRGPEEEPPR
jgi:DNA-binding NarL/FixJ family response regulator